MNPNAFGLALQILESAWCAHNTPWEVMYRFYLLAKHSFLSAFYFQFSLVLQWLTIILTYDVMMASLISQDIPKPPKSSGILNSPRKCSSVGTPQFNSQHPLKVGKSIQVYNIIPAIPEVEAADHSRLILGLSHWVWNMRCLITKGVGDCRASSAGKCLGYLHLWP